MPQEEPGFPWGPVVTLVALLPIVVALLVWLTRVQRRAIDCARDSLETTRTALDLQREAIDITHKSIESNNKLLVAQNETNRLLIELNARLAERSQ